MAQFEEVEEFEEALLVEAAAEDAEQPALRMAWILGRLAVIEELTFDILKKLPAFLFFIAQNA